MGLLKKSPLVRILQTVSESQILIQTEHSLFKDPSIFFYYGRVTFLDKVKDSSERTWKRLKRVAQVNFYRFSFFNYVFNVLISLIFHMLKNL